MSDRTRWLQFHDRESNTVFLYPVESAIEQAMMEPCRQAPGPLGRWLWTLFFAAILLFPVALEAWR